MTKLFDLIARFWIHLQPDPLLDIYPQSQNKAWCSTGLWQNTQTYIVEGDAYSSDHDDCVDDGSFYEGIY